MRRGITLMVLVACLMTSVPVHGKGVVREADFRRFTDYLWAAGGAATGLIVHEFGHLLSDYVLGKRVDFVEASLGPLPFFAIKPCCNVSRREDAWISQAGFLMQNVGTELIYGFVPDIRRRHHPFLKGMLFFNIGLSIGYGITALFDIGPRTSDVLSWSSAQGRPSWQSGVMLLVPAGIDLYRYFVPGSRWAPYASIGAKLTMIGVTLAM